MTAFVDTSAWYAAADSSDASNARSQRWLSSGEPLLTTDHVLAETWLLLRHRLGRPAAERFWTGLRSSGVTLECVTAADLESAYATGQMFADQDWSVVDRTSFAVMERLRLERVATLDSDFAVYRYGPRRQRAFTMLE
ncbi:MAG: PIN domain-containing protein [Actinomycetota bacterium]|nr:PIN domain-containing protein [Actinomycetota bacterium]